MKIKTIKDFDLFQKRVLARCDFNVPMKDGEILDDFRIKRTLPTLKYLIKKKAKIILISHLGRPEGKVVEELRLKPIGKRIEKLLRKKIFIATECIGKKVEELSQSLKEGEILLLENIRFCPQEEKNDPEFAKNLARLGDIFINEAFSASHRKHASVYEIAKILPSGIGLLFEEELKNLEYFLKNYQRPLVALIGGAKIEDKALLIERFSQTGDWVLVNHLIWQEIKAKGIKIQNNVLGPIDGVDGNLDIGEKTIKLFVEKIKKAKTIFWNGPFGKIENAKYEKGTKEIAKAIVKTKAFSLVGGGETVEFINKIKLTSKFSFVSTGGGAMLEFLSGKKLPGLEILGYYED